MILHLTVDQRQQYFIPDIVTTSCHITAQCKSLSGHTDGECTIMYTTEFTNQTDIGQTHMVSLDTVVLLPYLMPRLVTHYVHFTASLNEGLSVSESIIVEPMLQNLGKTESNIIASIASKFNFFLQFLIGQTLFQCWAYTQIGDS